ncbi:dihydrolipoyl dehydrogenase [Brucella intermedia]|uniref:Dihydrolipoyl dehydrogenase n=2 Tax=Brucella/Ochrobactrum group TaxID=2826938 RepID=A0A292GPR2_9HYPH|nr:MULTISPECIES: dihydrolipoyl dehydrogenase [Brucella/Ochrobactrum group]ERI15101.1 dihydrolipoamide dehydrogenase [Ochrobactrum sp. EGD-AQ16]PJT21579.1 dihydrolipoyl dehydrogenase [Ochrobactrum sp. 30A/1000/2015]PJT39817.1 dihydrolipoyl dehydrogenase [Ochrobactrum sp. 27A/999/2015]PJT44110.1 dihydrolipoyl dehydrogenase [Ochrobactrum sp. 23A/997/2015]BBA73250.1 dihydrolipoamide dehydrogenase [Ochrobactrum sp. PW1]
MSEISCKLLIIGGGPGGYVCGIRAGQLGIDTVLVEKTRLGGTCLNVGCIPSKALIHAADEFHRLSVFASKGALGISAENPAIDFARTLEWKDGIVNRLNSGVAGLLKRSRVRMFHGQARFLDGKTVLVETDTGRQTIHAENIVIATGSVPVEIQALPFGGKIISSTEALSLEKIPEKLAIVGGGYIGLEIGTAFAKLGAKVTVVEATDRILPQYDAELTRPIMARLKALGVEVLTGTSAKGLSKDEAGLEVLTADGTTKTIEADRILVTVGRKPQTDGWGLSEIRLDMDGRFIRIDERCRTSMRGVYAIGDVTGEPMLAHRAMAQGEMVAEIIAGGNQVWDKRCIPAVCFTDPEIVTVGLSPDEARKAGHEIQVGIFPFQANGRAMTVEREDGMIRVVARADNHLILGIQAVGVGISELSSSFAQAVEMGARLEDIAATIHAHPTLSEGFVEASMKALGHALHV